MPICWKFPAIMDSGVAEPRAYAKSVRCGSRYRYSDPTLSNARCCGSAPTQCFGDQSAEVELRVRMLFPLGEMATVTGFDNRPQAVCNKPMISLLCPHPARPCVARALLMEMMHSFATPAKFDSVWGVEGCGFWWEGCAVEKAEYIEGRLPCL